MQMGQFETIECKVCLHWSTTNSDGICWRCKDDL